MFWYLNNNLQGLTHHDMFLLSADFLLTWTTRLQNVCTNTEKLMNWNK